MHCYWNVASLHWCFFHIFFHWILKTCYCRNMASINLMPFSRCFLLDVVSTERQKLPMDAKRWVLLSSIKFLSMTLMTNFSAEESIVGYSRFRIWPIFNDFAISIELGISIVHTKSRMPYLYFCFGYNL